MADSNRKVISSAIKTIVESATGGNVHESHRYTRTPEGFKQYFTELISLEQRRVNTWLIHRDGFTQTSDGMPIGQEMREHLWTVEGFFGLQDAAGSEEAFQDLVEDIVDAIEGRTKLGAESVVEYAYPPDVPVIDHEWFGVALCHHCQIQLRVLERRRLAYVP